MRSTEGSESVAGDSNSASRNACRPSAGTPDGCRNICQGHARASTNGILVVIRQGDVIPLAPWPSFAIRTADERLAELRLGQFSLASIQRLGRPAPADSATSGP